MFGLRHFESLLVIRPFSLVHSSFFGDQLESLGVANKVIQSCELCHVVCESTKLAKLVLIWRSLKPNFGTYETMSEQ